MAKKKDDEKVLGPGAFGDLEHPDEGVQPGLLSDEVMGEHSDKDEKEKD